MLAGVEQIEGSSRSVLRTDHASKSYRSQLALAPLSLEIERGERVALMGPSGSGKTTLLYLLAGALMPDTGHVFIDDRDSRSYKQGSLLASKVGVMPQGYDIIPSLAVVHNVLAGRLGSWGLIRSMVSLLSPREADIALEALTTVGIPEKLYERSDRLSGGEQQRVALARVLVQKPATILADEPVSSVDPARADDLMSLLVGITDEKRQTLVVSLHSVELAIRHCTRIVALRAGELAFDRPTESVTSDDLEMLYRIESADAVPSVPESV